jgi:hypothetical protein
MKAQPPEKKKKKKNTDIRVAWPSYTVVPRKGLCIISM